MKRCLVLAVVAVGLGALAPGLAGASFTCTTIARTGQVTPDGFTFARRYDYPDVNSSGSVVFVGSPLGNRDRLYLFPAVGAPSTIEGAAPNQASQAPNVLRPATTPRGREETFWPDQNTERLSAKKIRAGAERNPSASTKSIRPVSV